MKKFIFLFLLGAAILISCVKEFNAELPDTDVDLLVVEGDILAHSDALFILSKTFSLSEDWLPDGYNDIKATLCVVGSDGYRSEPGIAVDKGQYKVSVGELKKDIEYWLEIEYNGEMYQSAPEKPLYTSPIDSVSFIQRGFGDVVFSLSTHSTAKEKQYYMWTFDEDWEIEMPYYVTIFYDPDKDNFYQLSDDPYFYCWQHEASSAILIGSTETLAENTISNQKLHTISSSSDKVQTLYCISVSQRAISREAYLYYQNKKKYSEEMGGLFTPQPSELPSNMVCLTNRAKKAIGYVGVSLNTASCRKFVSKYELSLPTAQRCDEPQFVQTSSNRYKYQEGYRPILKDPIEGIIWREKRCTDCRTKGTKTKPVFWPNDHR